MESTKALNQKALHAACRSFDVDFWDEGFRTEIFPDNYTDAEKWHLEKAMSSAIRSYLTALAEQGEAAQPAEGWVSVDDKLPPLVTPEQENAYIDIALHDIEDKRGPMRESNQVFREFYRAIKAVMDRWDANGTLAALRERLADTHKTIDRVWCALGIATYDDAGGKEISTIVADWKARAEAAEARVKQIRAETIEECAGVLEAVLADDDGTAAFALAEAIMRIRALANANTGKGCGDAD